MRIGIFAATMAVAVCTAGAVIEWPAAIKAKIGGVAAPVPVDLRFGLPAAPLAPSTGMDAAATGNGTAGGLLSGKIGAIDMPSKVTLTTDQSGVLLSEEQYAGLTNAVTVLSQFASRQWAMIHSNAQTRIAFHGDILFQHVSTNDASNMIETHTLYRDGYEFREPDRKVRNVRTRIDLGKPGRMDALRQRIANLESSTNAADIVRVAAMRKQLARMEVQSVTNEVNLVVRPESAGGK